MFRLYVLLDSKFILVLILKHATEIHLQYSFFQIKIFIVRKNCKVLISGVSKV